MKSLGIVRKIDNLGRVVIPKEIRRTNGWEPGTPLEMCQTEEGLFLREYGRQTEAKTLIDELDKANINVTDESVKLAISKAIDFIAKG